MQTPVWTAYEFINAGILTSGSAAVSGSFAQLLSGVAYPGLVHPEAVTITSSGLTATVSTPLPFQILFGNGVLAAASGVTTGSPSTSYSASFSGLVPGSGTVTAYLAASGTQIQLNAYQVVGPPPGHPDYNPTFIPSTAYSLQLDSVSIYTSLTAPDSINSFELARATIAAAATGVTLSTIYQRRASSSLAAQVLQVSGAVVLTVAAYGGRTLQFTATGTAFLPFVSGANGVRFEIANQTSGTVAVAASGSDLIYGINVAGGGSSATITGYGSVRVVGQNGVWQIAGVSQSMASTSFLGLVLASQTPFTSGFTIQDGYLYLVDTTAGSFSGTYAGAGTSLSNFGVNFGGVNPFAINWGASGKFRGDASTTVIFPENLYLFQWSGNNRGFG